MANAHTAKDHGRNKYYVEDFMPKHLEKPRDLPTWQLYLYQLKNEAPKPNKIPCKREPPNKPAYFGTEYHGYISREEAEDILATGGNGSYLVRKSDRAPNAFTLAIRFENQTKNYKLYYDGLHYVGEKRFQTVDQLVADGLIHFYIELKAPDYFVSLTEGINLRAITVSSSHC